MAKNYDNQKSLRNTGIFLVLIAAGVVLALVWAVIRNAGNAAKYTTAVTGTVISSSVYHTLDHKNHKESYSDITIQYDGLNGSLHTIERTHLYGAYKEGENLSLRCTEDREEAVLKEDTEQNPIFIGCLSVIALFFGSVGIALIKGKVTG